MQTEQPVNLNPCPVRCELPPRLVEVKDGCSGCRLHPLCLSAGLSHAELEQLGQVVNVHHTLRRGEYLYRAGQSFSSLYVLRRGFFKMYDLSEDGREKIVGLYMPGALLEMGAISTGHYNYSAIAVEDSDLCAIPFNRLEELFRRVPRLQHWFYRVMSREIIRDQEIMKLLSGMRAEERLAVFLLDLSDRFKELGYSSTRFILRLTREEIGNYLGLTLETVSRLFSRFQAEGLIGVNGKEMRLSDLTALKMMGAGQEYAVSKYKLNSGVEVIRSLPHA